MDRLAPPPQKKRRLSLVVNNSRFVVRIRVPNLASRVMKLCIEPVSSDWLRTYNHEGRVAERMAALLPAAGPVLGGHDV